VPTHKFYQHFVLPSAKIVLERVVAAMLTGAITVASVTLTPGVFAINALMIP